MSLRNLTAAVMMFCGLNVLAQDTNVLQDKKAPQLESALADAVPNSAKRYTWRDEHDRNGLGKFYMGREIAMVTGGIPWLERTEREEEERLSLLIKSLKLKPGDRVADIGAGAGVISMLMAEQVVDHGYVLAVDVQDQMLRRIQQNAKAKGLTNVIPIKGTQTSPSLAPESVDMIIMVDVYHEFEFPYEIMGEISKSLRPGGRLVFVEYRMEDPTVPIKVVHKMTQKQVKLEMSPPEFQLTFKETINALPWQHIIIFTKDASVEE